jgi:hypothetical protein
MAKNVSFAGIEIVQHGKLTQNPFHMLRRLSAPARLITRRVSIAAMAAVAFAAPVAASAQATRATGNPSRVASINPFIILFGYFSGEYEQRVSPTLALALAGSSISFEDNDDRRTNVDLKVRLYPNERALHGFGLGASVGWTQLRDRGFEYPDCFVFPDVSCEPVRRDKTYDAPSVAIEISYQWLLGSMRSTAITIGGGAKRAFTSAENWGFNERIVPTGRLSVGYAF